MPRKDKGKDKQSHTQQMLMKEIQKSSHTLLMALDLLLLKIIIIRTMYFACNLD